VCKRERAHGEIGSQRVGRRQSCSFTKILFLWFGSEMSFQGHVLKAWLPADGIIGRSWNL
jgi:hypothetical protein